jgi:hypothetical protein
VTEGLSLCFVPLVRLAISQLCFVHAQGMVRIKFAPNFAPCERVERQFFSTVFRYGGLCILGSSCSCSNGCETFFAFANIFRGFLPDVVHCFLECRKSMEKWADSNRYQRGSGAGVRGALVLWCSGTRMGSGALKRGFSVLVTGYSDGI